jgi:hypothetical protein
MQLESFARPEIPRPSAAVPRHADGPEADDVIVALTSVLETVIGSECCLASMARVVPMVATAW